MKEDGEESLLVGEEGDTSRSKSGRYKLEYDLLLLVMAGRTQEQEHGG